MARNWGVILLLAQLLGMEGVARADGFSGLVQPGYSGSKTTVVDQTGQAASTSTSLFAQKYQLSLDRGLYPYLRANAGGFLQKSLGSALTNGLASDLEQTRSHLFGGLTLNGPVLRGSAGYRRREDFGEGIFTSNRAFVNESYYATADWLPRGLPSFNASVGLSQLYDKPRELRNETATIATLRSSYSPFKGGDLRYSLVYGNPVDHLHRTDLKSYVHTGTASAGGTFFSGRTTAFAQYSLTNTTSVLAAIGAGGVLIEQRSPVEGLSGVETFPATPTNSTLTVDGAMVDGDTATPTGLNIGFGPSRAGDTNPRDAAARLADLITRVNTLYVWVDRPLPSAVIDAIAWTAYQSDDNLTWTQVPLRGGVGFGVFENRFEIPIAETQARYLKVVTRPLATAVTTDTQFTDIFITELQLLQVRPAESVPQSSSATSHALSASANTRILDVPGLSHSVSFTLANQSALPTTFVLANALTFSHRLSPVFALSARAGRTDSNFGRGFEGALQYGATLTADPLPSLSHGLSYSGQTTWFAAGTRSTQGLSLVNRVALYSGVSLTATGGYALTLNGPGQLRQSLSFNGGAAVAPHRTVSLSGSYGYSYAVDSAQPGRPASGDQLDLSLSVNPFSALYLSAGASRSRTAGASPRTMFNLALGFSPFRGGALQVGLTANQALDATNNTISRSLGPTLRWRIRSGLLLDGAYSLMQTDAPSARATISSFTANLRMTL